MKKGLAALALAVGAITSTFVGAPTARADINDEAYIMTLDMAGIRYPSVQAAIEAGHAICNGLDMGVRKPTMFATVADLLRTDVGTAAYIVGAAVAAYCPEHSYLGVSGGYLT